MKTVNYRVFVSEFVRLSRAKKSSGGRPISPSVCIQIPFCMHTDLNRYAWPFDSVCILIRWSMHTAACLQAYTIEVTYMSITFRTEPIPSSMGKGAGGYRGRITGRPDGRTLDEIAAAVAQRSACTAAQIKCIFTDVWDEVLRDACRTGRSQCLGDFATLALNLHGRFDGIDDHFDPKRHTLKFTLTPGRKLRKPATTFEIENVIKSPQIVIHSIVGEFDGRILPEDRYMIWGRETLCTGVYLLLKEGTIPTWSCKLADRTECSGALDVCENDTCVLNFRWPAEIPEAAIGQTVTLHFTFRGKEDDSVPVSREYAVHLCPPKSGLR